MQKKTIIFDIATKAGLIIFISSLTISVIIGGLWFNDSKNQIALNTGEKLQNIVNIAVSFIDTNNISTAFNDEDFYNKIYPILLMLKESTKEKFPMYVFKPKSKQKMIIVGSTEEGNVYGSDYRLNKTMKDVLKNNKPLYSGIYKDNSGVWISAYSPIIGKTNNILGILEINSEISNYLNKLSQKFRYVIIICFFACFVGLFFGYICFKPVVNNIRILNNASEQISQKNYENEIVIKSNDEIGNLASSMEHMRISLKEYIQKLSRILWDEKKAHLESIKTLSEAIAIREPYTKGHIKRVSQVARIIANELKLNLEQKETLEYGCILHDVGKIGVNVDIINKDCSLDYKEYEKIKQHPELGAKIIEGIPFLAKAKDIVLYHQEKYDGTGYPKGLKAEAIPLLARIVAVVDTYDAIVSDRSYKEGSSHEKAVQTIKEQSSKQFDPIIVDVFLKVEGKIKQIYMERED